MVALLREQVRACSLYTSSTLEEKHCCGYYSREGDRWKFEKQIKNRTLYTWRLFLLIRPFQYISNWLKVFEHLPSLISQSICSNNFFKFCYIINFSVDYTNLHLNSANTSLLIIAGTPSTLKLLIKSHPSSRLQFFSDVVLVSNDHGYKGEEIKLIPYYMIDIIYKTVKSSDLKNCKSYKMWKT